MCVLANKGRKAKASSLGERAAQSTGPQCEPVAPRLPKPLPLTPLCLRRQKQPRLLAYLGPALLHQLWLPLWTASVLVSMLTATVFPQKYVSPS